MPRPNQSRILMSLWISRDGKTAIAELARQRGETASETHRTLLRYAMQYMPPDWGRDTEEGPK